MRKEKGDGTRQERREGKEGAKERAKEKPKERAKEGGRKEGETGTHGMDDVAEPLKDVDGGDHVTLAEAFECVNTHGHELLPLLVCP